MVHQKYRLYGCLKFGSSTYPVTVPVYQRDRSNRLFVPKTDARFLILDFYSLDEGAYEVLIGEVRDQNLLRTDIGSFACVPLLEGNNSYFVDPNWSVQQIQKFEPKLAQNTIKAFLSLRERILKKSYNDPREDEEIVDNAFLEIPVSSRYWVSKFRAAVTSASNNGRLSSKRKIYFRNQRKEWIRRFSNKAPLVCLEQILEAPEIAIGNKSKTSIFLTRFALQLRSKGLSIPKSELKRYAQLFPNGAVAELQIRFRNAVDMAQVQRELNDNVYSAVLKRFDREHVDPFDPHTWQLDELKNWEVFFRSVYGKERIPKQVADLIDGLLNYSIAYLADISANYEDLEHLIYYGQAGPYNTPRLLNAVGMKSEELSLTKEKRAAVIERIRQLNSKMELLSAIVNRQSLDEVRETTGFKSIDYNNLKSILNYGEE
ncbi:UV-damage repair protein [Roseibium sp. TrichSKD4]|uniref:hypothetical protein n=1 Tax=Roseibium sp. TrichSKD4 TaxID=744980 RepID=UPI0001E575A9|nr:hypothetical protein [Roseibium sp. TrichSKD4]EFO30916.1 UV-damage repair protein [Roseibium sp. TrichSKD4]